MLIRVIAVLATLWTAGSVSPAPPRLTMVRVLASAEGGMSQDRFVDAATGRNGDVYVLIADGTIRKIRAGQVIGRWGSKGSAPGQFQRPTNIALGPSDRVYVHDQQLQAITIFESTGRFVRRETTPVPLSSRSMAVAGDGTVFISGSIREASNHTSQVHVLCPRINCYARGLGELRQTSDPRARPYFQGGHIQLSDSAVYLALINPNRIHRYSRASGPDRLMHTSNLLPDAEPLAFTTGENNSMSISNVYPRTSGFVRLHDGSFVYSAIFPREGYSVIRLLSPSGELKSSAQVPVYLRLVGVRRNGNLLLITEYDRQQLAEYRLESTSG